MDDAHDPLPEGEAALALPAAPYPGLRPFEKHEWAIFFGRETMTHEIITRLVDKRLVAIHGDSGCGKSSLVRAGVLPVLEMDHARVGASWKTVVMRPEDSPLDNLAKALSFDDASRRDRIKNILTRAENAPRPLADLLGCSSENNVCILLDQFEELFEQARKKGPLEAEIITAFLAGLLKDKPAGLHAIITMRSDYLGQCAHYRGFAETVNETQYLVPRMERPALWRAIREPAALYGGTIEPALVDRLTADAGTGQDQLPLIQHGLMLMWRNKTGGDSSREGWTLNVSDYSYRGGLSDLLSLHADAVMAKAAPKEEDRRILEAAFRALTDRNADRQAIRRPQTLAELCEVSGAEPERLQAILAPFRAADASFVRPYGEAALGPQSRVDISHEAFIRNWARLADPERGWLAQEADDGLRWAALKLSARGFAKDSSELLSPAMAEESSALIARTNPAWASRHGGDWQNIGALVAASRRSVQLRRRRVRFWMNAAVIAAAVLMAGLAAYAINQANLAEEQSEAAQAARRQAEAAAAEAQTQRDIAEDARRQAQAAAIEAQAQRDIAEAEAARAKEEEARAQEAADQAFHSQTVSLAALSRVEMAAGRPLDALKLVLAAWPRVGDERREQLRLTLAAMSDILPKIYERSRTPTAAKVIAMENTADGQLFTAGADGRISKWDPVTGIEVDAFFAPLANLVSFSVAPDGARVAAANEEQVVVVSVASGQTDYVLPIVRAVAVRFSPDKSKLATAAADGSLVIWDAASGTEIVRIAMVEDGGRTDGTEPKIMTLAFSPDGQKLAVRRPDSRVEIRSAATLERELYFPEDFFRRQDLASSTTEIRSMAYSSSGKRLVTVSTDNMVQFWDPVAGKALWSFVSSDTSPATAAFLSDERFAVIGSVDGRLTIVDIDNRRLVRTYFGHERRVTGLWASEAAIISVAEDLTLRLWSLPRAQRAVDLRGHEGSVVSVAFSPDDSRLATGSHDRTARIWNAATGENLRTLSGHGRAVMYAAFSPVGPTLATASEEGQARTWDLNTGAPGTFFNGHGKPVWTAEYSPDGERIVTASDDGILVWGAADGVEQVRLGERDMRVVSAAFSPDGKSILSAGPNGAVLWNAVTGEQLKAFTLASSTFHWSTFSPDGRQVALVGNAGIGISDVASGQQVGELFGSATAGYAIDYSNDGRRLVTGSNDQSAYVFDAATGVVIETLEGQEHDVYFATFSSSDELVATATKDNLAVVWDISSVEEGSALEIACSRLGKNTSLAEIEQRYSFAPLTLICGDNPPVPAEWAKLR